FGDDNLSDLDFSEYDHDYDFKAVLGGMRLGLSSRDIIYPLISTAKQWYYNSASTDHTYGDQRANIALHTGHSTGEGHGILWTELKPAIAVKPVLAKIQDTYNVTFSQDFLGSDVLDRLYLWLSNEKGKMIEQKERYKLDFQYHHANMTFFDLDNDWYKTTLKSHTTFSPQLGDEFISGEISVTPTDFYSDVEYTLSQKKEVGGQITALGENLTGYNYIEFYTRFFENRTFDIEYSFFMESKEYMEYSLRLMIRKRRWNGSSWALVEEEVVMSDDRGSSDKIEIKNEIPEMKVKEFFSGLVSMYNLVIIPENDSSFYIDTLDNWYADATMYDISKHIDITKSEVSRGKVISNVKFNFEEDDTILIDQFNKINGYQYGNLETQLKDRNFQNLDGEDLDISVKFGNMIFERLTDISTGNITDIQYGAAIDDNLEPTDTNPLLFYGVLTQISTPMSVITDRDSQYSLTSCFMPSHVNNHSTKAYSTVWNAELDEWDNQLIENSLYKLYYEDYITDIFNEKRRVFDYTAKLPDYLLSKIKLNDKLLINGTRFIINNMEINLTTNEVKLELLNDIYELDVLLPPEPKYQAVTLARNGSDGQTSCDNWDADDTRTYYIKTGETFETATQLFTSNSETTQFFASTGYYSDGEITRRLAFGIFRSTVPCGNGSGTALVNVSYAKQASQACSNFADGKSYGFYIPAGQNFETATKLYSNFDGTIPTLSQYYSDGNVVRYWNKSAQKFASTQNC
ncbi:hypothetical protein LCGC14_1633900, partial [marine sediment metagenome]